MTVAVCVALPASGGRIGSYHGGISFDSLAARVLTLRHPSDGSRLENDRVRGKVSFAGASATGFAGGAFLTVTLRLANRGHAPPINLRIAELNDASGASLLGSLLVRSPGNAGTRRSSAADTAPPTALDSCSAGVPRIRTITPIVVDISSGDTSPIEIAGCGFAASNILRIGPVTFPEVPALERGTRIRFVVPFTIAATGEAPPRRMPIGLVDVTVTTAVATSNRLQLTLK